MPYEIRTTALSVCRKSEGRLSDHTTEIRITDDGAGEFVEVQQLASTVNGQIGISREEWPSLREAIDRLLGECRHD